MESDEQAGLTVEWDLDKGKANLRKHGVSFAEAATVFTDALSETFPDPYHSVDEDRYVTVGMSAQGRLLVVVHADRVGGIRIISARATTRSERKFYEEKR